LPIVMDGIWFRSPIGCFSRPRAIDGGIFVLDSISQ
jgi:hypothetical protein